LIYNGKKETLFQLYRMQKRRIFTTILSSTYLYWRRWI